MANMTIVAPPPLLLFLLLKRVADLLLHRRGRGPRIIISSFFEAVNSMIFL